MQINEKRLIDTFIELVKINSESGEEKEIISYLKKEVEGHGFKASIDKVGNLIASNSKQPKLLLSAHADTVKPGNNIKPIIKNGIIQTDGSTILGSDDKAGIAVILEIIRSLREKNLKIGLELAFTVEEETGNRGAANLDIKKIKSKRGINLDAKAGEVIVGEPAIMQFNIEIQGKAAHSGVAPEKGISVITIASEAISKLKWGRLDEETTSNVGIIKAGEARNIVAEKAEIRAEVRSRDMAKFKKHVDLITKQFKETAKKYGGKIKIEATQISWPYKISQNNELVKAIIEACKKNKIKCELKMSGGVTDANSLIRKGLQMISSGAMGENIHSKQENIKINDLTNGAKVIYDTVVYLSKI